MQTQQSQRTFSYGPHTVKLSQLFEDLCDNGFLDYLFSASSLNPTECHQPPILESMRIDDQPHYSLVDGFHRTAGMIRWCIEHSVKPDDVTVSVVITDDDDLIADMDSGNDEDEQAAIDRILELAIA